MAADGDWCRNIVRKCLINFRGERSVLPCFPETRQHWVVNFNRYIMEYDKTLLFIVKRKDE